MCLRADFFVSAEVTAYARLTDLCMTELRITVEKELTGEEGAKKLGKFIKRQEKKKDINVVESVTEAIATPQIHDDILYRLKAVHAAIHETL